MFGSFWLYNTVTFSKVQIDIDYGIISSDQEIAIEIDISRLYDVIQPCCPNRLENAKNDRCDKKMSGKDINIIRFY